MVIMSSNDLAARCSPSRRNGIYGNLMTDFNDPVADNVTRVLGATDILDYIKVQYDTFQLFIYRFSEPGNDKTQHVIDNDCCVRHLVVLITRHGKKTILANDVLQAYAF